MNLLTKFLQPPYFLSKSTLKQELRHLKYSSVSSDFHTSIVAPQIWQRMGKFLLSNMNIKCRRRRVTMA